MRAYDKKPLLPDALLGEATVELSSLSLGDSHVAGSGGGANVQVIFHIAVATTLVNSLHRSLCLPPPRLAPEQLRPRLLTLRAVDAGLP